jgi:hypothetical protein
MHVSVSHQQADPGMSSFTHPVILSVSEESRGRDSSLTLRMTLFDRLQCEGLFLVIEPYHPNQASLR